MFFDTMKNKELYYTLHPKFAKAFAFLEQAAEQDLTPGKHEIDGEELYASVQAYDTKAPQDGSFEGHRNYIDIQYIISGIESIEVIDLSKAVAKTEYDAQNDYALYQDHPKAVKAVIEGGEYGIFFPHDIHKPGMAADGVSAPVKKIVVKVKL